MPLMTIDITNEVTTETKKLISESTYLSLRKGILDRTPIAEVTEKIRAKLNEHLEKDLEKSKKDFQEAAFTAQKEQDQQEDIGDQQEEAKDKLAKVDYTDKLKDAEIELAGLHLRRQELQNDCEYHAIMLKAPEGNLNTINEELGRVAIQRELILSHYKSNTTTNTVHSHEHNSSLHTHEHSASPATTVHSHEQANATVAVAYSSEDQNALNRLATTETTLHARQAALAPLVHKTKAELSDAQRRLQQNVDTKSTLQNLYTDLQRKLGDLSNKEVKRSSRLQLRQQRAMAALSNQPLQQLSTRIAERMQQLTSDDEKALDKIYQKAMAHTLEVSYPIFLSELELTLPNNTASNLTVNENVALTQILALIKTYFVKEARESQLTQQLANENLSLSSKEAELARNKDLLSQFADTKPRLTQENQELAAKNILLNKSMNEANDSRTVALSLLLVGMALDAGVLYASLVDAAILLSPLYPIFVTAVVLFSLASLIAAVVYHVNKTSDEEVIAKNQGTITSNVDEMDRQDRQTIHINQNAPELNIQITALKASISQINTQLALVRAEKQKLLADANAVKTEMMRSSPGKEGFFSTSGTALSTIELPPSYDQACLAPSAP